MRRASSGTYLERLALRALAPRDIRPPSSLVFPPSSAPTRAAAERDTERPANLQSADSRNTGSISPLPATPRSIAAVPPHHELVHPEPKREIEGGAQRIEAASPDPGQQRPTRTTRGAERIPMQSALAEVHMPVVRAIGVVQPETPLLAQHRRSTLGVAAEVPTLGRLQLQPQRTARSEGVRPISTPAAAATGGSGRDIRHSQPGEGRPAVHIGTIEVVVTPAAPVIRTSAINSPTPLPAPEPTATAPKPSGPLSRGFAAGIGLAQG